MSSKDHVDNLLPAVSSLLEIGSSMLKTRPRCNLSARLTTIPCVPERRVYPNRRLRALVIKRMLVSIGTLVSQKVNRLKINRYSTSCSKICDYCCRSAAILCLSAAGPECWCTRIHNDPRKDVPPAVAQNRQSNKLALAARHRGAEAGA